MGRRAATLPLFVTLAAAASMDAMDAASSTAGVDVLSRCQALVQTTPLSTSQTPTFLTLAADSLPSDVSAALAARSLAWTSLSDVMRIGVLWAHGYVLPGGSGGKGVAPIKVYTACGDINAGAVALEAVDGRFMDDIALPGAAFTAAACAQNTCGTYFQATNDKCSSRLTTQLLCAVDAKGLAESNDSFWSDAGKDSTAVPKPQVYTQALTVANGSANATVKLVSINMAATLTGTTQCGNTGDTVVPCLPLADAAKGGQQFCRPKVDSVRLKNYLDVVSKYLKDAAAAASATTKSDNGSKSSGLSTGAIAGIVGGVVVVLGLLAFYFVRAKKSRGNNEPEYPDFGRKSSNGNGARGGNATGNGAQGFSTGFQSKAMQRQGTFPVIDSTHDNDTVFSTDYVGGGGDTQLDEDSRQRPFSRRLLQSQEGGTARSRNSSITGSSRGMYGKSVDEYCEESEIIRDFVNDPQIKIRQIPYEELTVLRILSKGSYGEVFLGQLETRHIAMKRLLPEKKHLTKSIEQFMGEIQIMCNLEHRNIVTFVGVSWDYLQNISVIVEYMDNGDLAEVLTKFKLKYTWPKEKISISMDVAEGLVYLHSMRPVIVHRDLKSKNVLLNKRGQAKLSDFGVSRKTTVNETMTSGVGTLLWTAPEIIEGRKYSEKADIFSLGVVLSEIDTCEEPYSTVTNEETGERLPGMQIVQMVRLGQLKVSFRDDCPPKLRELARQCTDLDPDKRPTSMEVAYTLKSIIAPSLRA